MDRKIKTRQVHKDIKVLDKTVTVTDHVKQSYVRTKENIMQSTEKSSDRENNPVGYACLLYTSGQKGTSGNTECKEERSGAA